MHTSTCVIAMASRAIKKANLIHSNITRVMILKSRQKSKTDKAAKIPALIVTHRNERKGNTSMTNIYCEIDIAITIILRYLYVTCLIQYNQ